MLVCDVSQKDLSREEEPACIVCTRILEFDGPDILRRVNFFANDRRRSVPFTYTKYTITITIRGSLPMTMMVCIIILSSINA